MKYSSFRVVENQIRIAYETANCSWCLQDCIDVFSYFYEAYHSRTGCEHPRLRTETIGKAMERLDEVEDDYGRVFTLTPEDYPKIIDAYFEEVFESCNYSIAHFMSGSIRLYRCYETGVI